MAGPASRAQETRVPVVSGDVSLRRRPPASAAVAGAAWRSAIRAELLRRLEWLSARLTGFGVNGEAVETSAAEEPGDVDDVVGGSFDPKLVERQAARLPHQTATVVRGERRLVRKRDRPGPRLGLPSPSVDGGLRRLVGAHDDAASCVHDDLRGL